MSHTSHRQHERHSACLVDAHLPSPDSAGNTLQPMTVLQQIAASWKSARCHRRQHGQTGACERLRDRRRTACGSALTRSRQITSNRSQDPVAWTLPSVTARPLPSSSSARRVPAPGDLVGLVAGQRSTTRWARAGAPPGHDHPRSADRPRQRRAHGTARGRADSIRRFDRPFSSIGCKSRHVGADFPGRLDGSFHCFPCDDRDVASHVVGGLDCRPLEAERTTLLRDLRRSSSTAWMVPLMACLATEPRSPPIASTALSTLLPKY